jgi:hypothetical protein
MMQGQKTIKLVKKVGVFIEEKGWLENSYFRANPFPV